MLVRCPVAQEVAGTQAFGERECSALGLLHSGALRAHRNLVSLHHIMGFSYSSVGKESACNAGDLGLIPGSGKSPGEGNGNSIQCSFLPGEFHGQRSMVGYSLTPLFSSYLGFPGTARSKEPTCQCRRCKRHGFNPWVGRSPGGGLGNPLQYSHLENLMDRGA